MTKHSYIFPCLLGIVCFMLIIGVNVLIPTNIAWLSSGDPAQHYLGWAFFRNSPWTWPLGLNPTFGLEISSGIISSDSNPLFAFLFKPFSRFLPETFQYFGFWILLAFILQAFFSWKLLSLITQNLMIQIFGTAFFVFSPPFLNRISGHMSLGGHFLILAALYFSLNKEISRRKLIWSVLIIVTALVHPYLLAMVALIWISNLIFQILIKNLSFKLASFEFFIVFFCMIIACWQEGYFAVGVLGSAVSGYENFTMNVLSPISPSGWSYFLNSTPLNIGGGEGFNYLGLGLIILLVLALLRIFKQKTNLYITIKNNYFLLILLVFLTIYAISNNISIGSKTFTYRFPPLEFIAFFFRSCGRMFWPVWYMITFATLYILIKTYQKNTVMILLAITLSIQIIDTHAGWGNIRASKNIQPNSTWNISLKDSFWDHAALHYQKIRNGAFGDFDDLILKKNDWFTFAYYSSAHHLSTDIAGLARIPKNSNQSQNIIYEVYKKIFYPKTRLQKSNLSSAYRVSQKNLEDKFKSGNFDKDSLYILNKESYDQLKQSINQNTDLLTQVDGVYVLAPNWY